MTNELRFDGRVALVTGAGGGLGRTHALLFASRGCKVVVNDLGGSMHGGGASSSAADKVVAEIKAAGGEAVANYDSVESGDKIVQTALDTWGRIDIVVNNAGILRDTSFQKLSEEDWDLIYRVHVLGAFRVTKAAWGPMRDAGYGRVVFTASAAGIYGNFGQANYSTAKLGLVGLASTLALEGKKRNVLVNTIAPIAGSRLTETVMPKDLVDALRPEYVSPLVACLCHESSTETGGLFEVGGGFFSKLRWERTVGKSFPLGRPITPEQVHSAFGAIGDFSKTEHPGDITQSMQPVLTNLSKKSRGGNDLIDADAALGFEFPPLESRHTERDVALYALGVGAGRDPLDEVDLRYVYEMHPEGFLPLPTFAATPAINAILEMAKQGVKAPGMNYGLDRILHGEQYTELRAPIPLSGKLTHKARIKEIWDKGKHAVVVTETRSFDDQGAEVALNEIAMVVRGAGGWGGDRGPAGDTAAAPDRAPDAVVEQAIEPDQALLYRLSGDWNPLHADPGFARAFGFPRPILHGMSTYGYAVRHVIKSFAKGDARYVKSVRARFADSVFPGETLITQMWKVGEGKVVFSCKVKERDKVVLQGGVAELLAEPLARKTEAKAATSAASAVAAAPATPSSADVFEGVRFYVAEHPELVGQIGTLFQFKLSSPDSSWIIDLKSGKGAVSQGVVDKPDVTFELSEADFVGMASGALNPQKLYFGGKLKIGGNVMAAQKLDFLQKIDKAKVAEAMKQKAGAAAPVAAPAAAPQELATPSSADVFEGVRSYVAEHPELVGQIGTLFQFKLSSPDSSWIIDLKSGKGAVSQGVVDKPDVTFELSEADFVGMASGALNPQKLYFGGKLKIGGNVMAAQKLDFLQKIDKAKVAEAMKQKAASAPAAAAPAAAPAAPKGTSAAAVVRALAAAAERAPGLLAEVGAVVRCELTDAGQSFTIDGKSSPPAVREGGGAADTTIRLTAADLDELLKGASAQDLYQRGRLRVDGDVAAARRLGVLKGLSVSA